MNAEKCTQLNMSNYYPKHTSKKYWLSLFNPPTSGGTALLPPLCPNRLFSEVLGWNPGLECGRECSTTGPRPTPLIKFLVVPQAPFPITLWGLLCNFASQPFLGRDTLHYKAELTWGHRPYGPQSLSVYCLTLYRKGNPDFRQLTLPFTSCSLEIGFYPQHHEIQETKPSLFQILY